MGVGLLDLISLAAFSRCGRPAVKMLSTLPTRSHIPRFLIYDEPKPLKRGDGGTISNEFEVLEHSKPWENRRKGGWPHSPNSIIRMKLGKLSMGIGDEVGELMNGSKQGH